MSTDVKCLTHGDKRAAGFCSRCQMPYCADCLDLEMGQPLCLSCKKKFAAAVAPSPAAGSPLNFKGKGLDDDPLGLFGAPPSAPKMEPPKAATPQLDIPPATPTAPKVETPKPSAPKLDFNLSDLAAPVTSAPAAINPPSKPSFPGVAQAPALKAPLDLDSLASNPSMAGSAAGPSASASKAALDLDSLVPKAALPKPSIPPITGPPPLTQAAPLTFSKDLKAGIPPATVKKKNKFLSLSKIWAKYLLRRSYEMFDPLAKVLHVPTYVFLALMAALITGAVVGVGAYLNRPTVALVDVIQPIHFVQVNSGQISEMDVTTYADLQSQVQAKGFTPLIQMTIPQLPSPNFFDVGMKENIGTYSEILKRQREITPHLSLVTVFTNGVWYSTNGWKGDNQQMTYLVSEYYPQDSLDQLYVKHVQGIEKFKQDKGWQVESMSQDRYMAALSDHLRWFLDKKGIAAYNASLNLWH